MAKTYAQLNAEIEILKAKAGAALKKEAAGVIARIKEAIAFYGLTAADLGLSKSDSRARHPSSVKAAKQGKSKLPAKYRDQAGNSWTGRGSRPRWLAAAIAAGASLDSFAVNGTSTKAASAKQRGGPKPGSPAKAKKTAPAATYRDGDKSWSGRGPKPGWLKQALAAGKSLDDLRG
jgi:DNA-binding protein H-NS